MQQYIVYKRVSTKEQGRSGLGLDAQERDITLYLERFSPAPYEVLDTFTDVLSGTDNDRPELKLALELARRTGATLLVSKLDRLSRKVSAIAALMEDRKVAFRVAQMPNADNFQLHIYAALAEQEREFISARTRAALAEAKRRGTKLGGIRDKTMKRNASVQANAKARAQKVAGIILPMREAGKPLREIARHLNQAGVDTARGGKWQASQVARTLERLAAINEQSHFGQSERPQQTS
jgi:DNA invertase Pin-like site-specific DNA recombinase